MNIDDIIVTIAADDRPQPEVVARHRAKLDAAIGRSSERGRLGRHLENRRLVLVGAAAAAAAGVFVLDPFGSDGQSVDALVADAAATTAGLAHSGRVAVTTSDRSGADQQQVTFAGDDVAIWRDGREVLRWVDGSSYVLSDQYCPDEEEWWMDGNISRPAYPQLDRVLTALSPTAQFDLVDDESVGGIPTQHLRAGAPQALVLADIDLPQFDAAGSGVANEVTGFDIWVDSTDVVRRIDVALTSTSGTDVERFETSMVFADLGADIHVDVPESYRILPTDLATDPCSAPVHTNR